MSTAHASTDVLKWAAVSAGTLAVVEVALLRSTGSYYTDMYRQARTGPFRWVPVVVAGVIVAHLEGWLPEQVDPLHQTVSALGAASQRIPTPTR